MFKRYLPQKITLELLVLGAILCLGAYLRLHNIADYLTFLGDEGRDVLIVKRIIVDHDITFLGPTASVGGFFLGPMYYYFMVPFLWLFRLDPVGPAVMVALFGIATIYLMYHVGKRFFHPFVGLVASSVYALSPLVIAYSRSSWNPNLVPFFALLLVFLLWRYAVYKKERDLLFAGLVMGLGIQFHYLFSFLIILSVLWIVGIERSLRTVRKIVIMIIGGCITFSPFLLFEIRHSFPNGRSILNFFRAGQETGFTGSGFVATVTDVAFRSVGRLLYRMPNYDQWDGFPDWQVTAWVVIIRTTIWVSLLLLTTFVLTRISRIPTQIRSFSKKHFSLQEHQWWGAVLLGIWFVFCVLMFGFYRRGIYDYYFGIFFGFPFLMLGVIFWQMLRNKVGAVVACILWMLLLWYNWEGRPFIYPPNKQMQQTRNIAQAAIDLTHNEPYNFALVTVTNSDHAYRYFFEIWNRPPTVLEHTAVDPEGKSITNQLIVICEDPRCQPLGHPLWEVAGFGRAEIVEEKDVFPVKIFRLVHYKETL